MLSTKFRAARKDHSRSAQTPTHFSLTPRVLLVSGLAIALVACAPATVTSGNGGSGGGKGGSGGNQSGGSGGNQSGGSGGNQSGGSGGNSGGSGGTTAKGGSGGNSGGSGGNSGGSGGNSGGSGGNSGGSGGTTAKGGSGGNSGGSGGTSGGSGGTSSGSGGGSGGVSGSGGGSGGNATGGTTAGGAGGTSTGGRPPGYFLTADWNVTKADWHGCVWTGKDCSSNCPTGVTPVTGSTTSVTPVDFTSGTPNGGPYEIKGTVFNDYNAVALLGFNINEAIDSTKGATQCANDPNSATKDGPPTATIPSGATGIAVNWSATTLPVTFRIQIQGVKGGGDPTNRWCATITDTKGPSFIPFSSFNTQCWPGATNPVAYKNEPFDAVAFLVPGTTTSKSPYDITVVGFAPGTSAADAPGPAAACGTRTGTVGQSALQGDTTKDTDASTQRAVTDGKDCHKYIVNNNNWGQEATTYQKLSFTGNSFSVDAMNGTGSSAPASFPSLYVGGNGQTLNGTFVTWDDTFPSKQPTAISAIQSAQSTFKWSGKSSGDFNASYDIWFSKSIPTSGSYNDAISGFIMLWLYKPSSRQPIGSSVRSATIAGIDWDVWAGPRGNTSTGTDPAGRPVISYVAKSSTQSFSGDLKAFFTDAVSKADSSNGITQTFSSSWYLTDVFAGFEIWSGGAGLKEDEFSIAIK